MIVSIVTTSNMLRKHSQTFFPIVFLFCTGLLLSACAPTQSVLPVEPQTSKPTPDENQAKVETYALGQDSNIISSENPLVTQISDPWQLLELAHSKVAPEREDYLLHAIERFLDQRHYSTAFTQLEQLTSEPLNNEQQTHGALLNARYYLLTGNLTQASSRVRQIKQNSTLSQANFVRWLQLDIAISTEQKMIKPAVLARLQLNEILSANGRNPSLQLENQAQILSSLATHQQLFSAAELGAPGNTLSAWLDLAALQRDHQLNDSAFTQWRQLHPGHSARADLLSALLTTGPISSDKIALLLPMTSSLGRAAQAFKTGFDAAIAATGRFDTSRVYDIGTEAALVPFYYRNAVNDGADFIIGPLGRKGVQSMLEYLNSNVGLRAPTLILGEIPEASGSASNVWGLSLSAEQDAAAIAERAIEQGFRQAVVMEKNNAWGARLSTAFTTAFEAKGGEIVGRQRYMPSEVDHSVQVKNLLNIPDSDLRHAKLQNILGRKLKFSVRRRDDIDFVFLAGAAKDARHILPLLKFYRAHNMPVYATASAYTGAFNRFTDEDLSGLQFTDLPWLLNASISAQNTDQTALAEAHNLPYQNATLNRLYALGYAAFEVLPHLGQLQSNDMSKVDTQTMSLRLDERNNLIHTIAWGNYTTKGIAMKP